jgi:hypothetical protein
LYSTTVKAPPDCSLQHGVLSSDAIFGIDPHPNRSAKAKDRCSEETCVRIVDCCVVGVFVNSTTNHALTKKKTTLRLVQCHFKLLQHWHPQPYRRTTSTPESQRNSSILPSSYSSCGVDFADDFIEKAHEWGEYEEHHREND